MINQNFIAQTFGLPCISYNAASFISLSIFQAFSIYVKAKKLTGNIELKISSQNNLQPLLVEIKDNAYKTGSIKKIIDPKNGESKIIIDLSKSHGWYDFSVKIKDNNLFEKRFAGHVETGNFSITDPLMGGEI